ncbi:FG-GAP-like repeat-containing protein [Candidatus Halobeggiatoa sp. HSG11]|nr:FG-GAP-like repeat-containing protein [Candidatus Halobeggiatoa sp. HSG11]
MKQLLPILLILITPTLQAAATFSSEKVVTTSATGTQSVYAIDVDGDSDIDILSASYEDDKIAWYENDGSQNFTTRVVTTAADSARSVYAIDVDGDSDIDILSASREDDKIAWYENDGSQNFTAHDVSLAADGTLSVYAIDVDGDTDIDILSASVYDNKIAWYENDGSQNFTTHVITTAADSAISVYAIDVDGDNDIDILSASSGDDKIAWYENDGSQNFTTHDVSLAADGARSVYAIDVDGDNDIDILSASSGDDKIAWYENDGSQNFTTHDVSLAADGARSVYAIDMDGDSDIDILSASSGDDKIAWYENDGSQNFTTHDVNLAAESARSVYAIDMDGDSDIDILSASSSDDKIAWYENDGSQNFTTHVLTTAADGAWSVYAIDVGGDSDIDILSASVYDNKIAWYENIIEVSSISATDGTYNIAASVDITVQLTSTVNVTGTPQLTLETGTTDAVVDYSSGSGTDTLTFTYTVASGEVSADLDYVSTTSLSLNGGTIQDSNTNDADLTLPTPGATGSLGDNNAIIIDGIMPTISNTTATTADGTYIIGDTIDITIQFSEIVNVTGTPQLTLETGTTDTVVDYSSGSGTDTLTFTYTVASGENNSDLDYASTTALSGGTIKNAATNDADLTLPSPGTTNSLGDNKALVVDSIAATITNITTTSIDGTYIIGDTIDITIQFSEIVNVTGTPQLTLETGTTDAVVDYSSGSGTDTLTFTYTVASGENNSDLDYASTTALSGGTIQDAATNNADLTLPSPGTTNSLGDNKALIIVTTVPNDPTSLSTSASETQINLSWTDNSSNETGFKIERNGSLVTTTAADATTNSNSGLSCGTTYSYSVKATNTIGDSNPISKSATTSACPITVYHNLTVEKTGNGTITTSYGIDCGTDCEYDYADQTELSLIATPDTGWIFTGWSGDCDDDGAVRINGDKSCTVTFITPNVEISTNTMSLTEGISKNGYSLSLNLAPTEPVTITFENTEELILEPTSLTFDDSNWDIPQTVQITDINDDLAEGLHEHIISHTVASNDNNFNNLQIENVTIQVTDDDSPAVHLSTNNVIINEGDINSYNIVLTSQPLNDVTIALNTNENTILNPTTLFFTAENWNVPQDITISVEDDSLDEGEHQHDPIQHQVSSADLNYDGLAVNDVTVNIIDNDISSILLSTYTLNINEGENDNITIALSIIPTQPVTVNLIPEAGITLSPESITFDSNNWNASQTISVTSIEDEIITNEIHTVHINTTSNDLNYNNLAVENLIVNVADNEKPNVLLSSDQITVFEEGTGGNYTLVLTVEPANPVTINLTVSEHTQVSPQTIVFTPTNWNIEQTVTVTAVDDELVEEDTHINTITHKVSSDDVGYNNLLVPDVTVNIVDELAQVDLGNIILECQDCTIKNAALVDIASLPKSTESYSFPTDLIRFELEATETAHVDIYYKNINSLDNFVYRKYGPTTPGNSSTIGWYNFSNATFTLVDNMVKVSLTLTDGQLGDDTGVDGIIIDDGGIAIQESALEENLPEGMNPDEITLEEPEIAQESSLASACGTSQICNAGEQTITEEITLGNNASISNATFEADVENQGLIGNSTIGEGVTLTGGSLTGTIINKGTIENITFIGSGISGGILSGNITNESQVGGVIKDVELTPGTVIKGGKIGGIITGSPIDPPVITDVEVLPGTVLTNIILSPTVKLSDDVILGEGVSIATEPYTSEDFGIDAEDIANLDAEQFSKLELEALATFAPEDIASIPPEALTEMEPEQMAVIEGLEGLTEEQFAEIPMEALEGLTEKNMGDFSIEVIDKFAPEHVEALSPKVFKKLSSKQASKLLIHFNSNQISPQNIYKLLPDGWQINGTALILPIGTEFTPPLLVGKSSNRILLPEIADIKSGIGIGGTGTNIKIGMENALEHQDLTDFILSQDDNGILKVEGIGDSEGKQYAFIPDADDAIQVDTDEIPIGLSVGPGGFYTITTPEGQQYKVVPAPKDPAILSEVTGNEVTVGKRGDVMIKSSNRTRSTEVYEIVMFDPFVEDFAPDNLCIEIFPGELECDGNLRRRSSRAKTRKIEYSDGTAQTIRPTVLSPDVFIEEALKFEGVEQVVYKADGTFAILYQGNPYFVVPNFTVQNERISEAVEPSIVPNGDGSIKYSIAIESETNTRSTEVYEMLSFDPFLEAAPDDLCIEIMPGELECDF